MCGIGNWRAYSSTRVDGVLLALEQCTECYEHRAKKIDDAPVVGSDGGDSTEEGVWG